MFDSTTQDPQKPTRAEAAGRRLPHGLPRVLGLAPDVVVQQGLRQLVAGVRTMAPRADGFRRPAPRGSLCFFGTVSLGWVTGGTGGGLVDGVP